MATIKTPDLNQYSKQSGSGSGSQGTGTAPPGYHWDAAQQKYVPDVTVQTYGDDGHVYDLQKSPNGSGLDWFTVQTVRNAVQADAAYTEAINNGGYWQVLADGVLWTNSKQTYTNLPVNARYAATEKKAAADYLKDIWSIEGNYTSPPVWVWLKDYASLAAAKAGVLTMGDTVPCTAADPDAAVRITDKTGAAVYYAKGVPYDPRTNPDVNSYTDKNGVNWYRQKDGSWSTSDPNAGVPAAYSGGAPAAPSGGAPAEPGAALPFAFPKLNAGLSGLIMGLIITAAVIGAVLLAATKEME